MFDVQVGTWTLVIKESDKIDEDLPIYTLEITDNIPGKIHLDFELDSNQMIILQDAKIIRK